MSKRPVKAPSKPVKLHFHEMNLQRLCLISIQRQIDKQKDHSWKIVHEAEGDEPYTLECVGNPRYGIPHGHDNDFMNAVVHMFVENGAPEDGRVTATAYEILKLAGKPDNKQNYEALRESLLRLEISKYYIGRAWYNRSHRRWEVVSFAHIQQLSFTSETSASDFQRSSVIEIILPPAVVQSVRSGYLLPADEAILRELSQPTSRSLYRLLEASRRDPEDPSKMVDEFTESIIAWGQTCKLFSDRPDLIRRTLNTAHQELVTAGYLKEVEYTGKGSKQTVTYRFNLHYEKIPDARKVEALQLYGVNPGVARKYALKYADWVDPVLNRYRQLVEGGLYKTINPAGLIVRMLQNPADYGVEPLKQLPGVAETTPEKPPTLPEAQPLPQAAGLDEMETFIRYLLVSSCVHKGLMKNPELDAFLTCLREDPALMESTFHQFKALLMQNKPEAYLAEVQKVLNRGGLFA